MRRVVVYREDVPEGEYSVGEVLFRARGRGAIETLDAQLDDVARTLAELLEALVLGGTLSPEVAAALLPDARFNHWRVRVDEGVG